MRTKYSGHADPRTFHFLEGKTLNTAQVCTKQDSEQGQHPNNTPVICVSKFISDLGCKPRYNTRPYLFKNGCVEQGIIIVLQTYLICSNIGHPSTLVFSIHGQGWLHVKFMRKIKRWQRASAVFSYHAGNHTHKWSDKLASLILSWQSSKGTFRAPGMTEIEPKPS